MIKIILMKKFILLMLFACLLLAGWAKSQARSTLIIMTFNIRRFTLIDGLDSWIFRKEKVNQLIKKYHPHLAGLQEVTPLQVKDLEKSLPEYNWFGLPRADGKRRGERCPIFYLKARFALLSHSTFWLSETPDVAGSISWGSACKRIVSWGKFKDLESGKVFYLFNTHFDHQSSLARKKSAELILEKIKQIAGTAPVIITGDFNCEEGSKPYQIITERFLDARKITLSPPQGPEGTSWSFIPYSPATRRIDFIFVCPSIKVLEYRAIDDTYAKVRRYSDHLPVLAKILLPEK